jgi:hypothetical protein
MEDVNVRRSALCHLAVIALLLILIGCSRQPAASPETTRPGQVLANGSVVDDIRVGVPIECPATDPECETRLALAKEAAIARHGLVPTAIGAAHFYMTYLAPGAAYGSGGDAIVVFDLDDGSKAAIRTVCFDGCFVVEPQPVRPLTLEPAIDHGPLVDPFVEAPVECASADHPTCSEAVKVAIATASEDGFLAPDTIADAHYYVTFLPPDSPAAAAMKAEYLVDIYIAGDHDLLAETAIAVSCGSGPCQVVSSTDTSIPPEGSPVPES